ncbi:MAG: alpha/beta hydrolase [Lachnospiraceae bacterium]|nr:alpha/beta hydrolase [Lachnospiraceae bacterium]
MKEKVHTTSYGKIHYWTNKEQVNSDYALVFLPGLTADHRLFDKQAEYFEDKYTIFVWDAPGHASSTPFELKFSLMDKAGWLSEILEKEEMDKPIIIGQSMGGYVGQAFMERFPGKLKGFISIDSAPLQRQYVTGAEIWMLKRMEPVYRHYPWKSLLKSGSNGCAVSEYGRKLMRDIMMVYDKDKKRYARLAGHGFLMLADAMEADLSYKIDCPALLICGKRDQAGSTKRYNKAWHKKTGIPIEWIENAGHNSNTDQPELINSLIERFMERL